MYIEHPLYSCPVCGREGSIPGLIVHLHNEHGYGLELAKWLIRNLLGT